jgi:stress-induced morphogen
MSINVPRGSIDEVMARIIEALRSYETDHPAARIDLYRQNSVSIRVRVIDPDFAGQTKVERHRTVWNSLNRLSDDDQADISTLILLTPDETQRSFANMEFEDPVPSSL